ncbi:hypothetical protein PVAP13_4KG163500 [Panicum virgatum]|uniref:Uncharacterized protein n=1 Tax=Panicum virgatum TaxID=38727 RepID=A0A8T0TRG3_PANVG|nr:hypothetical protein PVAP13_4KG163500 [Panicum virgatum]
MSAEPDTCYWWSRDFVIAHAVFASGFVTAPVAVLLLHRPRSGRAIFFAAFATFCTTISLILCCRFYAEPRLPPWLSAGGGQHWQEGSGGRPGAVVVARPSRPGGGAGVDGQLRRGDAGRPRRGPYPVLRVRAAPGRRRRGLRRVPRRAGQGRGRAAAAGVSPRVPQRVHRPVAARARHLPDLPLRGASGTWEEGTRRHEIKSARQQIAPPHQLETRPRGVDYGGIPKRVENDDDEAINCVWGPGGAPWGDVTPRRAIVVAAVEVELGAGEEEAAGEEVDGQLVDREDHDE